MHLKLPITPSIRRATAPRRGTIRASSRPNRPAARGTAAQCLFKIAKNCFALKAMISYYDYKLSTKMADGIHRRQRWDETSWARARD